MAIHSEPYILVVEDDFDIRETVMQILAEEGYRVEGAANGEEALDTLQGGDLPSVILLDLMMPVMNGWQFRAAQLLDPRIAAVPVIILSADAGIQQKVSGLMPADVLRKPIQLGELLAALKRRV